MLNSVLELSGWKLVESVTRLLKGSFLTKEQAMAVCRAALACVHEKDEEKVDDLALKG
jgi:hypothetical protein